MGLNIFGVANFPLHPPLFLRARLVFSHFSVCVILLPFLHGFLLFDMCTGVSSVRLAACRSTVFVCFHVRTFQQMLHVFEFAGRVRPFVARWHRTAIIVVIVPCLLQWLQSLIFAWIVGSLLIYRRLWFHHSYKFELSVVVDDSVRWM